MVLKAIGPLLKQKSVTVVPFAIRGTSSNPSFALDFTAERRESSLRPASEPLHFIRYTTAPICIHLMSNFVAGYTLAVAPLFLFPAMKIDVIAVRQAIAEDFRQQS